MQIFCVGFFHAQSPDTVSLGNVDIVAKKELATNTGKRIETLDSAVMVPYNLQSLSELIAAGTGVFVKSYGPGAIASSALRGGNATQTAFVWNGFNLQNTMLGQTDMSLLPVALFDEVQVDYGASAASWGSGAVGGAIHVRDNHEEIRGLHGVLTLGAGSFGRRSLNGRFTYGNKRLSFVTRFYGNLAENNYSYTDPLDDQHTEKKLQSAAYMMRGVLQQVKWLTGKRSALHVNGWLNNAEREIPSINATRESKTKQTDKSIRVTADHKFEGNRYTSILKTAFFDEKMIYEDSLAMIFTHNKIKTFMAEAENYYRWNGKHESGVFLLTNHSFGNTEYYTKQQQYSRSGLVLTHRVKLFQQRVEVLGLTRAEYFSAGTLPVTWNAGVTWRLHKNLTLLANGGRFYRQPALNELYWTPGGNPDLKPEQGYSLEGSLEFKKSFGLIDFSFAGSVFGRRTENWILWVPGPGARPEARNIQAVESRGTDSKTSVYFRKNKLLTGIIANTSYVLSTVQENVLPYDASVGRQLIYTPRYTATGRLHVVYERLGFFSSFQYCGYRFTSSDNAQWLMPYYTLSARASYTFPISNASFDFFVAVHNITNEAYSVMAGRPMPGRNYEGGLIIKFKNNKKP